ncbi:MAG: pitrilysin family protein [bacterium]|nr:pitrilysin family protein [bacterium]
MLLRRVSFCLLLLIFPGCSLFDSVPQRPEGISSRDLSFKPAQPVEWHLQNGLRVMFLEDRELPMVSGTLYFLGGSVFDPKDRAGLASATGAQMRGGGVPGLLPQQLDAELDATGAAIESSFGEEYGTVSFSCLGDDLSRVFELFSSVVRNPSFNAERFKLWQKLAEEGIRRRADSPDVMAQMAFERILYGSNSGWRDRSTVVSVSAITLEDMKEFHRQYVVPHNAILALSGNISAAEARAMVEKFFVDWDGPRTKLKFPEVHRVIKPGIYVLERDFEQANVVMGHFGPGRYEGSFPARAVFNRIFGLGGFQSVLMNEVRTKRGLAYSVYGGLFPGRSIGVMQIGLGTRNEEVVNAIESIVEVVGGLKKEPVSAESLEDAALAEKGSFVFNFKDPGAIVARRALLSLLDYPKDFDATYLDTVSALNPRSLHKETNKELRPGEMAIVVVGRVSAAELARKFSERTPVYHLEFTEQALVGKIVHPEAGD